MSEDCENTSIGVGSTERAAFDHAAAFRCGPDSGGQAAVRASAASIDPDCTDSKPLSEQEALAAWFAHIDIMVNAGGQTGVGCIHEHDEGGVAFLHHLSNAAARKLIEARPGMMKEALKYYPSPP